MMFWLSERSAGQVKALVGLVLLTAVAVVVFSGGLWFLGVPLALIGLLVWGAHRKIQQLPLSLSKTAVVYELNGVPVVSVRARLGFGRRVHGVKVRATWWDGSQEYPLEWVNLGPGPVMGAWSVLALDRDRVVSGAGELRIEVEAVERQRALHVSSVWEGQALVCGEFSPLVTMKKGKLRLNARDWEHVTPSERALEETQ